MHQDAVEENSDVSGNQGNIQGNLHDNYLGNNVQGSIRDSYMADFFNA